MVAGDGKGAMATCADNTNATLAEEDGRGVDMTETSQNDGKKRRSGILYAKEKTCVVTDNGEINQNGFVDNDQIEAVQIDQQVAPQGDKHKSDNSLLENSQKDNVPLINDNMVLPDDDQVVPGENCHQVAEKETGHQVALKLTIQQVPSMSDSPATPNDSLNSPSYLTATESLSSPSTLCNTVTLLNEDDVQKKDGGGGETCTSEDGLDDIDLPHPGTSSTSEGVPGLVVVAATPSTSGSSTADSNKFLHDAVMDTLAAPTPRGRRGQRKHTVLGVTEDARKVLDQFLRRSLSQNDASPLREHYQAELEMIVEDRPSPVLRNESYIQAASGEMALLYADEDETDALSHSPVSKSNSVYSNSSHSSSLKYKVRPMTEKDVEEALNKNHEKKKKKQLIKKKKRKDSVSSSSSSDVDGRERRKELRRKKSFFKRATERLRQSFRRIPHRIDFDDENELEEDERAKIRNKKKKFKLSLKRSGSDKSKTSSERTTPAGEGLQAQGMPATSASQTEYEKKQKSPTKVRRKDSFLSKGKDKDKSNKGLWDGILSQLKSVTSRKKSSKEGFNRRSQSEDGIAQKAVRLEGQSPVDDNTPGATKSFQQIDRRNHSHGDVNQVQISASAPSNVIQRPVLSPLPPLPAFPQQGAAAAASSHQGATPSEQKGALRDMLKLEGIGDPVPGTSSGSRRLPTNVVTDGNDDVDNSISPRSQRASSKQDSNKPFHLKTEEEKDEVYEKIAEQLACIGDHYYMQSPQSPKADLLAAGPSSPTLLGAAAMPELSLESQIGQRLREQGDKAAKDLEELNPLVRQMVSNMTYSSFSTALQSNLGQEAGWQQLAMVFKLTKDAVQLVGRGTGSALQIKEMTLKYIEDKFAGWIVGQGGWESMVEDTDHSSEVD